MQGCLLWQRDGLNPPAEIRAAAEAVRLAEDHLGQFLVDMADAFLQEPESNILFKQFYGLFKEWFLENVDERDRWLPSKKVIGRQLEDKGFSAFNKGGQKWIVGIERIPGSF